MKNKSLFIAALSMVTLVACQSTGTTYNGGNGAYGGNVYSSNQVNIAQKTNAGTIVSIQTAYVKGDDSLLAGLGGAVVGGYAGSKVGGGSGKKIARVVGAVAGASVANQTVKNVNREMKQITFQSDNSRQMYTVLQSDRQNMFYVGQRVLLIQDGRKLKVQPY